MISDLIKAKLKASAIHLGISAIIFLGILYLILFEWYPGVFFEAEGGWSGIKLMAAVDLVLGPSLTLIIFNHTKPKKEILLDLSLIVLVQISALIWGGLQVHSERPVALVFWEGSFYTVTEDYYNRQNLELKDVTTFSKEQPLIIYAATDYELDEAKEIQRLNEQKIPPYAQVQLYKSVKENMQKIQRSAISDEVLETYTGKDRGMLDSAKRESFIFLGKAKYRNLLIYLDAQSNLIDITAID